MRLLHCNTPTTPTTPPCHARALALVLTLLATVLCGCSADSAEQRLDNYVQRLARSLDQAPANAPIPDLPRMPRPATLQTELARSALGTLDFLALSGCAVQVTIGKRNSSLGIHARPSQRLLLELEYLQLAPACIETLSRRGETSLAVTLQNAWDLKRQQLPARIFAATLAGEEFRAFWQPPPTTGNYPEQTSSQVIIALDAMNAAVARWLAGDFGADNLAFELLLADVGSGDGGALLRALASQQAALGEADRLLAQRQAKGPLCEGNYRADGAEVLPNVVHKYFIGEVQPWAAKLNQRYYQLLPPVKRLEQQLDTALPSAYREWMAAREASYAMALDSSSRHVAAIQAIMAPCRTDNADNPLGTDATTPGQRQ